MTTNHEPTLILFDIDGTLLHPRGCGRASFTLALQELYGLPPDVMEAINFGGKTDWQILMEVLESHSPEAQDIRAAMPVFTDTIARHLRAIVGDYPVEPLPGAKALIDRLRCDPRARLGLVTGNVGVTAPIKLRAAGFDPAAFPVGAFGHEASDRSDLPLLAVQRAERHWGESFPPERVVVIGDTPADVICARAIGARAVAVLTGFSPREALEAVHPDAILNDLTHQAEVEAVLFGENHHG